jgi:hypothetical protein
MEKRTIIKFVGGSKDGEVLDSMNESPLNPDEAAGYLWMLNGGKIGAAFWTATDAAMDYIRQDPEHNHAGKAGFKPHVYKVTEREETDDLIKITVTFSGRDPKNP